MHKCTYMIPEHWIKRLIRLSEQRQWILQCSVILKAHLCMPTYIPLATSLVFDDEFCIVSLFLKRALRKGVVTQDDHLAYR